jgi:hypothetical protein
MNANAIRRFETLKGILGKAYGVADVTRQFAVDPTVEQRLQDKIIATSDFLQKINVVPVTELKGQNIFGATSGPVTMPPFCRPMQTAAAEIGQPNIDACGCGWPELKWK